MIIDSHNHPYYVSLTPEGMLQEMDAFGIDKAWLVTWYLPPGQYAPKSRNYNPINVRPDGSTEGMTVQDIVQTCQRYPDRFIPGWCPYPLEGNAADLFQWAHEMYGIRVCGEWSYQMLLDDPRAIELFRRAGQLGCPVVLHMDVPYLPDGQGNLVYQEVWYGGGMAQLERALQACPDTVIIGHAPGFWRFISGDEATATEEYPGGPVQPGGKVIELLDHYPNLWADLSAGSGLNAIRRDPAFGRDFILRYHERLLFGRDDKGNALQTYLESLGLPAAVSDKIFYQNALQLVPV